MFGRTLMTINMQESNFILEKMVEQNLIDPSLVKTKIGTIYFVHYKTKKDIHRVKIHSYNTPFYCETISNLKKISKNDWELHKKLIKEGVNPNEIAKIIRYDEIEKLQEISSQANFDFNQTIKPSLYERHDFVNEEDVSLIDYAAFFGSIKCFKYLLMKCKYRKFL